MDEYFLCVVLKVYVRQSIDCLFCYKVYKGE